MVSTSNDSFFDGVMRDIQRSSWSLHCSAGARAVMTGQGLHEAILSCDDKTRAVQLILIQNLRSVEEPLQYGVADGTHQGFTPLMTALVAGNPDIVRLLVSYGASPAATCAADLHNSVLHYACAARATESLQLLLMGLQRHRLLAPNDLGETPLHIAARCVFPDVIEALLRHFAALHVRDTLVLRQLQGEGAAEKDDELTRAAVTLVDAHGSTFAHLLVAHERTDTPFVSCLEMVASAVLRHGAQAVADKWGRTMFFRANTPAAVDLLSPGLPDAMPLDNGCASPLHYAASHGTNEAVDAVCRVLSAKYGIATSALVAITTSDGDTCLHQAARACRAENMAVLLAQLRGDAISQEHVLFKKSTSGDSVFHVAAASGATDCIARICQHVVSSGFACDAAREKLVAELLSQRNSMDFSPVLIAASNDAGDALQALIDFLASVGQVPHMKAAVQCHWVRQRTTALHLSLACGARQSAKVLLQALSGATAREQLDVLLAADDDGNTCLMAAVQSGSLDVLYVLLGSSGAVPCVEQCLRALQQVNKRGKTLAGIVEEQCGVRRAATSLPSSPLKRLATPAFPPVELEAFDSAISDFARLTVCVCDKRRPCIAKAAQAMIAGACAGTHVHSLPASECDL